jgi:23S rRNA pseudouridine1911/1915/1917 synthase
MNQGFNHTQVLKAQVAGQRLDAYLATRYKHSDLPTWQTRIDNAELWIDGAPASAQDLLQAGMTLEWRRPPWEEPAAPMDVSVIYQKGGVVVVCKPSGLPTQAGGGFFENTLVHWVKKNFGAAPMHRLGRWTSGAVLCSCNPIVGAGIAHQFSSRRVHKRYRALLQGLPQEERFEVTVPIGPVPYAPLGTLHAANPDGRASKSEFVVLERREDSSLSDVFISSGRPHQIRIHSAAAGHPLVGDPIYGPGGLPLPGTTALPGDPGYLLHSAELGFKHPETGERVTIIAPAPELLEL